MAVKTVDQLLAEIMVYCEIAKHPPTAVEVDVCGPLLRVAVLVVDCWRLEDPHGYFSSLDGYFLLGNPENIRSNGAAV